MTRPILISEKLLKETLEALQTLAWIYSADWIQGRNEQDPLAQRQQRKIEALIHQLERRRDRGKEEVAQ